MLLLQGVELVEDLLRRDGLVVDPALLALIGLDAYEAPAMFKHLELVAVGYGPVRLETAATRSRRNVCFAVT